MNDKNDSSRPRLSELELLHQLQQTPEIFTELQDLSGSELSVQTKLRAAYEPELVRAAINLNELRQKATHMVPAGDQLWVTRIGLEQATAWTVAQHKAARFPQGESVFDLCGGIGVDCAALLGRGPVTVVERDAAMLQRCEWNVEVWRNTSTIASDEPVQGLLADVRAGDYAGKLIHVDPDRRDSSDRPVRRLEQYCPDLDWMQTTVAAAKGGALKLGPASNFLQKFPGCQTEVISLNGECREATVWFGSLAEADPYRATVLPSGESIAADPLSAFCPLADSIDAYLCDPDPAVVRAGLVDAVGELHNLRRLDTSDEYMTANHAPDTNFVRPFKVAELLPNNVKELKRYLRGKAARSYEVKCRQLHIDANAIQKSLPRGDGPPLVIFFVRMAGKAKIVVAERVTPFTK